MRFPKGWKAGEMSGREEQGFSQKRFTQMETPRGRSCDLVSHALLTDAARHVSADPGRACVPCQRVLSGLPGRFGP